MLNQFSQEQIDLLKNFVTNVSEDVFALINLPEVIKGALFSKYSRSSLGLRELLLKEFLSKDNSIFHTTNTHNQLLHIEKAKDFYNRILDDFGDDSIGELGGTHIAFENISMLAAKFIENKRIGGSPLEKSTRYICFDKKVKDEYRFYKDPVLMTSAYKDIYLNTCNNLFITYSNLFIKLNKYLEQKFSIEQYTNHKSYIIAIKAKALDCLRGLLPVSTLTNLGVFGNGRFFDNLIKNLNINNLTEIQNLGEKTFNELDKVIPSFIKRSDVNHKTFKEYSHFMDQMKNDLKLLSTSIKDKITTEKKQGVFLIEYDEDCICTIAANLLFENSNHSLVDLKKYCKNLPEEDLSRILQSACFSRKNRRHKSPRALENAFFTFEIIADFGIYRDLQRHRMLTQERQLLNCDYGYDLPNELIESGLGKEYINAMESAKQTYEIIKTQFPEEAQYVVPMAYNLRWYMKINLRSLQWLTELRSSPAGHSNYRYVAQQMAKKVCEISPQLTRFFKFVDFDDYDIEKINKNNKDDSQKVLNETIN